MGVGQGYTYTYLSEQGMCEALYTYYTYCTYLGEQSVCEGEDEARAGVGVGVHVHAPQ